MIPSGLCHAWAVNRVALRNAAIVAALAGLVLLWERGFGEVADSLSLVIRVLFVAALIVFGYQYFRENQLAWLVLRPWQRQVIIGSSAAIVLLVIFGFPLLSDRITFLGVLALIAAFVLLIVWVVRESRRLP
jgi:hypothetical protein